MHMGGLCALTIVVNAMHVHLPFLCYVVIHRYCDGKIHCHKFDFVFVVIFVVVYIMFSPILFDLLYLYLLSYLMS